MDIYDIRTKNSAADVIDIDQIVGDIEHLRAEPVYQRVPGVILTPSPSSVRFKPHQVNKPSWNGRLESAQILQRACEDRTEDFRCGR